jgi:outer membrane protein OmpA-like peptidoglycan-associated protein
VLFPTISRAQTSEPPPIPNPFRGRLLSFHAGAGIDTYFGDAGSSRAGAFWRLGTVMQFMPEVGFGLSGSIGTLAYTRSLDMRSPDIYRFQFGTDAPQDRTTSISAFDFILLFSLFPRQAFNLYLEAGAAALLYTPADYSDETVRHKPRSDYLSSMAMVIGAGVEYQWHPSFSMFFNTRYHASFAKDLDAYDPVAIAREMPTAPATTPAASKDGFLCVALGIRWFPFASSDYDSDMLPNTREDSIGTDPYNPDTDTDKLSDGEEVLVYLTNPLKSDSDNDGLGDYTEVIVSHTNPNASDSDKDGLSDYDEVVRYKTNPNKSDTDDDDLTDFEEIIFYATDPLSPDTDCDGIMDGVEVKTLNTNPLKPDTDDDGLGDFDEVFAYKTDPKRKDTDNDALTDFEEARYFNTNPLVTDTDGDGLSDAYELLTLGTNPLRQDTDGDGIPDNIDPNPLMPESIAGSRRGVTPISKPTVDTMAFFGQKTLLVNINFDFGMYTIKPEYFSLLENYVGFFLQLPKVSIEIRGHTDFEGTEQFNQLLSENRAKAVRDFLAHRGVNASRIKVSGFGERYPLAQCETEECKALNRRVEFIIDDFSDSDTRRKLPK